MPNARGPNSALPFAIPKSSPSFKLFNALKEISRVKKKNSYICVESYRNEKEKQNLLYWQVTCESFYTPTEWKWWFKLTKYKGDYSFIFFE